jgi:hypothetical protein
MNASGFIYPDTDGSPAFAYDNFDPVDPAFRRLVTEGRLGKITYAINYGTNLATARIDGAGMTIPTTAVVVWQGTGGPPANRLTQDVVFTAPTPVLPAWTPALLPGCVANYDAQAIAQLDGTPVTLWSDQSSAGNHMIGPTDTTAQPTFLQVGVRGLPAVRFDGSNDYLTTAPFTAYTGAWTIYAVAVSSPLLVTGSDALFAGKPVSSTTNRLSIERLADNSVKIDQGSSSSLASAASVYDLNPHVLKAVFNSATSSIWIDGVSVASGTVAISSRDVNQLFLGSRSAGTNFFDGMIQQVIAVQGTVSAGDDTSLMAYLNRRWWF